jgi:hypothetical protein
MDGLKNLPIIYVCIFSSIGIILFVCLVAAIISDLTNNNDHDEEMENLRKFDKMLLEQNPHDWIEFHKEVGFEPKKR